MNMTGYLLARGCSRLADFAIKSASGPLPLLFHLFREAFAGVLGVLYCSPFVMRERIYKALAYITIRLAAIQNRLVYSKRDRAALERIFSNGDLRTQVVQYWTSQGDQRFLVQLKKYFDELDQWQTIGVIRDVEVVGSIKVLEQAKAFINESQDNWDE